MSALREAALQYAQRGWKLIPIRHESKAPHSSLAPRGLHDATDDAEIIGSWFAREPNLDAIAVAAQASGLLALDIDSVEGHGVDGYATLRDLERRHGALPETFRVVTPSGGQHYFYKCPGGTLPGSAGPGVDVKSIGYVLVPPSLHPNGLAYQIDAGSVDDVAELPPSWIAALSKPTKNGKAVATESLAAMPAHETMTRVAASMAAKDVPPAAITASVRALADQYNAEPARTRHISENEVRAIATSAVSKFSEVSLDVVFDRAPEELSVLAVQAPSMPPELLPDSLRPWIEDVCERMRVPIEMVAIPAIVACAGLVGRRLTIRPKRRDDWTVVPNLWGCVVCRSGFLKSPALAEALRPLRRVEADLRAMFEHERADHETNFRVIELEIQALETKIKSTKKKGEDVTQLVAELAEKQRAAEEARGFTEPRISTSDATVEKIGEILLQNPNGLTIMRDELLGWLRTLEKPGREGDRQFYLEAWNGDGAFTVDRIGRGTLHIPAVCLSVVGSTQPGALSAYVREAVAGGTGSDGLLQRVQLLVFPDDFPEWVNVDRFPDSAAKNTAYGAMKNLASLDPEVIGAEQDDAFCVRFNEDAQNVFDAWRDALEQRLRSAEFAENPALESHLAKYRSLMPSLALIFHLVDDAVTGVIVPRVSENAARRAADWCDFLEAHARKVYAGGETAAALALADRIESGDVLDGDTLRDIYRHGWSGLGTEERVLAAARILERASWLKVVRQGKAGQPGRSPSPRIALNPALRGEV